MKNIEQSRAITAWKAANADENKGNSDFETAVNKTLTYIKTNGLINTLAFMYDKGKKWETLAGVICSQLKERELIPSRFTTSKDLLEFLIHPDSTPRELMQITSETLALFNWLRRFVK